MQTKNFSSWDQRDVHPFPELGMFTTLLRGTTFRNTDRIVNAYYWLGAEGATMKSLKALHSQRLRSTGENRS